MVRTAFGQPHDKMGRVKLLIIRHGQSANNLLHATTGSYAGREADPLLTEKPVGSTTSKTASVFVLVLGSL